MGQRSRVTSIDRELWHDDERFVRFMKTNLIVATLVGSALFLSGCDDKKNPTSADALKDSASKVADATKDAATKAADATKDAATKAAEATKEAALKAADATKAAASKAVEAAKGMLDGKVKDAAQGYTSDLSKLGDSLAGIKSVEDATKVFPGLKDQITKVSGYAATLSTSTTEVKNKVMADFKPQIDSAVKKFKEQVDRISKDPMLSKVSGLTDSIKNLKLFE